MNWNVHGVQQAEWTKDDDSWRKKLEKMKFNGVVSNVEGGIGGMMDGDDDDGSVNGWQ